MIKLTIAICLATFLQTEKDHKSNNEQVEIKSTNKDISREIDALLKSLNSEEKDINKVLKKIDELAKNSDLIDQKKLAQYFADLRTPYKHNDDGTPYWWAEKVAHLTQLILATNEMSEDPVQRANRYTLILKIAEAERRESYIILLRHYRNGDLKKFNEYLKSTKKESIFQELNDKKDKIRELFDEQDRLIRLAYKGELNEDWARAMNNLLIECDKYTSLTPSLEVINCLQGIENKLKNEPAKNTEFKELLKAMDKDKSEFISSQIKNIIKGKTKPLSDSEIEYFKTPKPQN